MKFRKFAFALTLCLCLTACAPGGTAPSATPAANPVPPAPADVPPSLAVDEEAAVTLFRVVDGAEEGNLLLAKLSRNMGADVYRLPAGDIPVTLDGAASEPSALEDGMVVEVSHNGVTLESYPAQFGQVYQIAGYSIGSEKDPAESWYDLCGLYLQVLDALWEKDAGLNERISQAAVDLSGAPGGLTESEQAALIWRFGETHGVEAFAATFEELKEGGYLSFEPLGEDAPEGAAFTHWKDGCFFAIEAGEAPVGEGDSPAALAFGAKKWRSSLGAYFLHDCSAVWDASGRLEKYVIGAEMIS